MRRFLSYMTVGVLALTVGSACGDALGIEDIEGTWNTTSVNGDPVPGTVQFQGNTFDLQYYRFTFQRGGSCVLAYSVNSSAGENNDCDFQVNFKNAAIVIAVANLLDLGGTIEGDTMSLVDEVGTVYILRKQ